SALWDPQPASQRRERQHVRRQREVCLEQRRAEHVASREHHGWRRGGRRFLSRLFPLVSLLCLALLVAGCQRGPVVGTVKGKITLDGQPVDGGLIRLVPANGDSQPADCIVTAGAYSITMPIGEKKVEIYWTKSNLAGKVDTASQGSERVVAMVPPK